MNEATLSTVADLGDLALVYALDIVGAVILLIAGWLVAGWVRRGLMRLMDRSRRVDPTLKPLLAGIAHYTVLILVLIAVLAQFGVQTTSIIAVLGAAGIAVGLALQGTLSNIAAGAMLLTLRPFGVGDYIDADGIAGSVDEIGLFTTQLTTFDGVYVSAPNGQIWNRTIRNYSRLPTRRLDVAVGVSYGDDVERGLEVLRALLEEDERVLAEPAPQVMVKGLGESSVDLNMRCWVNAGDYFALTWDLNRLAKQRLEAAGLTIPFPQRDVHVFREPEAAPESA